MNYICATYQRKIPIMLECGLDLIGEVLIFEQMPPKIEYSLTDFGRTLIPLIEQLGLWADEHQDRLRNVILKRLEENK